MTYPRRYPLSDLGNAQRFADLNRDSLRWCTDTRRWLARPPDDRWHPITETELLARAVRAHAELATEARRFSAFFDKRDETTHYKRWVRESGMMRQLTVTICLARVLLESTECELLDLPFIPRLDDDDLNS